MDSKVKKGNEKGKKLSQKPRSLEVAARGIETGRDFAAFMSCLMSDLIEGKVSPQIGNAACNAGGKLLKVVEMQMRYGTTNPTNGEKVLNLALSKPLLETSEKLIQ